MKTISRSTALQISQEILRKAEQKRDEYVGRILDKTLQSFGRSAPCPIGYIWNEEQKKCLKIDDMTKRSKNG